MTTAVITAVTAVVTNAATTVVTNAVATVVTTAGTAVVTIAAATVVTTAVTTVVTTAVTTVVSTAVTTISTTAVTTVVLPIQGSQVETCRFEDIRTLKTYDFSASEAFVLIPVGYFVRHTFLKTYNTRCLCLKPSSLHIN